MPESEASDERSAVPPLFCVMGETLYDELESCLAPLQPVISMYDMRELRVISRQAESARRGFDIREIAELYLRRIRALQPTGPYRIAGFSAGGAVAFEIAQRLLQEGEEPALVILFDTLAISGLRKRGLVERQMVRIAGLRRRKLHSAYQFVKRMAARIRYRSSVVRKKSKSRRMRREELIEIRNAFYRQALMRYETRLYPGNVLLFKARIADRPGEYRCDKWLGWKNLVSGMLQVHELPCDHVGILTPPHVQSVANEILAFTREHRAGGVAAGATRQTDDTAASRSITEPL